MKSEANASLSLHPHLVCYQWTKGGQNRDEARLDHIFNDRFNVFVGLRCLFEEQILVVTNDDTAQDRLRQGFGAVF